MEQEFQRYQELLIEHHPVKISQSSDDDDNVNSFLPERCHPSVVKSAKRFNEHRQEAIKARWELTVHRQAVGFIVGNHQYVTQNYPIAEARRHRRHRTIAEVTDNINGSSHHIKRNNNSNNSSRLSAANLQRQHQHRSEGDVAAGVGGEWAHTMGARKCDILREL